MATKKIPSLSKASKKTTPPSSRDQNEKLTLEEPIDIHVKVQGQPVKTDNLSPAGIGDLAAAKQEANQLAKEEWQNKTNSTNSQMTTDTPLAVKLKQEELNQNQGNKVKDEKNDPSDQDEYYSPEVLSAKPTPSQSSSAVVWIVVLVIIILALLGLIVWWYLGQYGNLSQNEISSVKGSSAQPTTKQKISLDDPQIITDQTISANQPSLDISQDLSSLGSLIKDIEQTNHITPPEITFELPS